MIITSNNPEETMNIAYDLASTFKGGEIILLSGEMGAGKTTFTKGIAKALGIIDTITSPTFTIMNEYDGSLTLYHYDMYRIEIADELIELGIEDYIYSEGVSVIEWNKFNIMSDKIINIYLEYIDDTKRRISIE